MMLLTRALLATIAIAASAACNGPLELANIQVGRALNQDRSVSSITTLFKPNETIYVSVHTKAAGKGTISVTWKYGTRVIDQPSKTVDFDGPAATEFHMQNASGFPPGDYSVDVFIDGQPVGSRTFKVDRYFE